MSMEITIRPTPEIITVDGHPCRIWQGHTAEGIEVHAVIRLIVVSENVDTLAFNAALIEQPKPTDANAITKAIERNARTSS